MPAPLRTGCSATRWVDPRATTQRTREEESPADPDVCGRDQGVPGRRRIPPSAEGSLEGISIAGVTLFWSIFMSANLS